MKTMNETGSKAGIGTKVKRESFSSFISKSAYLLLMTVFAFSSMSFMQEDSFVNSGDTNQSLSKVKAVATTTVDNEVCCAIVASTPGKGVSNVNYISMPGKTAMYNADKEAIVGFINDVRERRIWSLNRRTVTTAADKAMHHQFKLSLIYPSGDMVLQADAETRKNFAVEMVQWVDFNNEVVAKADREVASQFFAEHVNVKITTPAVFEMRKADTVMSKAFEDRYQPSISLPSVDAYKKADEVMHQHFLVNAK